MNRSYKYSYIPDLHTYVVTFHLCIVILWMRLASCTKAVILFLNPYPAIRGRSQTMLTSFWVFWPPTPFRWQFLPNKSWHFLTKVLFIFRCSKIGKKSEGNHFTYKWLPSLFFANFTAAKDEKYFTYPPLVNVVCERPLMHIMQFLLLSMKIKLAANSNLKIGWFICIWKSCSNKETTTHILKKSPILFRHYLKVV